MPRPVLSYPLVLTLIRMLIVYAGISACEREDNMSAVPKPDMMMVPISDTLPSILAENTLLTNTHTWYIKDWVYVTNEATLKVDPGTIIKIIRKRDTSAGLVVTRGAKIIATGLRNWPVLFEVNDTANACDGSWSGIVLLGKAPQKHAHTVSDNTMAIRDASAWAYGGEQPDDSSGILQHVTIVTRPCKRDTAVSQLSEGLLLLGVGRKTVIEDVVVDTANNSPYRLEGLQLK